MVVEGSEEMFVEGRSIAWMSLMRDLILCVGWSHTSLILMFRQTYPFELIVEGPIEHYPNECKGRSYRTL